jgi:hypothetical protein
VSTVPVAGPSLYELVDAGNPEVQALAAAPDQLDRLKTIYGELKLGLAQSVVTEDFIRAYKSIDIFGFTISTHRYPFAILLLMFLSTIGIAWTVESARRGSKRVISDIHDDDVVDVALDMPWLRLVLWVIVPAFAIWASLPLFPLSNLEQYLVIGGVVLIIFVASVATLRAGAL